MDPTQNPFSPGAGLSPPELAGRDDLRETVRIAIERMKRGKASQSIVIIGLRGVGKTVLLNRMRLDAEATGITSLALEALEDRSLPALLAPALRKVLIRFSTIEKAGNLAGIALKALAGFAESLKVKFSDIEVGLDFAKEPGLADNGDLDHDLQELLAAAGAAARAADSALVIFIDELQYVPERQLAALTTALHHTCQEGLPVMLVGTGLPQLPGRLGAAKSYSERLYNFSELKPLSAAATRDALVKPVAAYQVQFTNDALAYIQKMTEGYPYFIQEWGSEAWKIARQSPITLDDVIKSSNLTIVNLDESFFRVRLDRLAPAEKKYLRAMAELGRGPARSGDIANILGRKVSSFGPVRKRLISKGMIWIPQHGDTAFTVPLFDDFIRRAMPGDAWKFD